MGVLLGGACGALGALLWARARSRMELLEKEQFLATKEQELNGARAELSIAKAEASARERRIEELTAQLSAEQEQLRALIAERATLRTQLTEAERRFKEAEELTTQLSAEQEQLRALIAERATLRTQLTEAERRFKEAEEQHRLSEEELQRREEAMRLQFKSLAGDILSEQSKRFNEASRDSMETLLKPFRENITDFRERVERIYATETEQHGALKSELKNLLELNQRITTETTNLTRALKGESKVQGDFGEMILDTILSSSNLVKGVHYLTQDTLKNEAGENLRPDVILNLPDKKQIIIDSKTSLTAYTNYVAAETAPEQTAALKAHVESVRKHVVELSSKQYQELISCSPDFVILFIPNESAFLAAMQGDPEIWADAYRRKVIISSPTNLFALLKLVDNLWQRSDLERNTREISECGSRIYDQLVAFTETLQGVEKGLKVAQGAYDEAYKRFTTGNNNLIRLGHRMAGLHVKIKKSLPQGVLDAAELEEQPNEE